MANIPLKTIKFPGLDDTYTVPQIDSSFTGVAGEAPDSNKVKGEIDSLKEDLNVINKAEFFTATVAVGGTKTLDILYADLPFTVSNGSALLIDMGISGTCKVNVYLIKNDNTTVSVASNVTASRKWPSVKKADYKGMRFFVFSVSVATTFTLNIQSAESFEQETADNRVVSYAVRNAKARFPFVVGDLNTSGGWAYSTYRLCTLGWQYTNESLLIVGNGKVKVYVDTADDSIGTNIVNVGWVTGTNGLTSYTIPANTYFVLIVADINGIEDSTNVITDVASSRIYRGLEIRSASDKTEEDDYIMDMVRSHIIASPQGIKSVAHQGYSLTGQATGHSTLSSVVGAYRFGFADIETDIKFSSDNVPVLSHDATFVDGNSGTTITISQHTASELQTYKYFGEKIATFDDFMKLSKMLGLTVWIDQPGVADSDPDNRWSALFAVVTKYQMQDKVVWLTMTEAHINRIVAYYPKSRFAFLGSDEFWTNYAISQAQLHTEVKDIIIDLNSANFTPSDVQTIASTLPSNCRAGIYTVDDKYTYKSYMPFVDAITSNKISAPMIAVQVAESYDVD